MKALHIAFITTVIALAQVVPAFGRDHGPDFDRAQKRSAYKPEIVSWTGIVHSVLDNEVDLQFVRNDDKEKFDIVDSPDLEKFDWVNHKSRLVKIEAEKTPRFLFWGGNLIVKNFEILKEAGRYEMPKQVTTHIVREFHDRR
ncbi:MAG: hypothetical protein KDD35_07135 [Bdellovibrionales bacterium]|nr:hypothetical protein [Bdellovibrionales bacterium]